MLFKRGRGAGWKDSVRERGGRERCGARVREFDTRVGVMKGVQFKGWHKDPTQGVCKGPTKWRNKG